MAKYIFLPVPGYGHVNPTLAVARELVARGQQVIYYLPEEFRLPVEATGATLRSYQSSLPAMMKRLTNLSQFRANPMSSQASPPMFSQFMTNENQLVLSQVLDSIHAERPDCILYVRMSVWAMIISRRLKIPAIQLYPSYASNELFMRQFMARMSTQGQAAGFEEFRNRMNEQLAELCRTYQVPPLSVQDLFRSGEPLNIVFVPRAFQPEGDTFDERFVFVGPAILPRPDPTGFPIEQLAGKTTLYISLGTVFNNQAEFFNMCIAAFKDSPWQVVLSLGQQVDPAALNPIPANFLVGSYVPQLEVLSHASLFISHCGMNSTMESLYYGVPLIGIPQMPEQEMTAHRVQELGLGIALDRQTITVQELHASVERVMGDPAYRGRVQQMQQQVRDAGGYQRAVDVIMHYEQTHRSTSSGGLQA